jgi:hypothetical protein
LSDLIRQKGGSPTVGNEEAVKLLQEMVNEMKKQNQKPVAVAAPPALRGAPAPGRRP